MPWSREEDFWRNTSILHFLSPNYLPYGWRVMKFTISGLLPLIMLHTKFGKDWPSSFWGEDVNVRRTTDDDGRQPIAIGHLSDSVDLKIEILSEVTHHFPRKAQLLFLRWSWKNSGGTHIWEKSRIWEIKSKMSLSLRKKLFGGTLW